MTQEQIYQNIARRTGGDIYLGVVGPVRSGKSTFIKRFSELLLLPHIQNEAQRARANLGSAAGTAGQLGQLNVLLIHPLSPFCLPLRPNRASSTPPPTAKALSLAQ